MQCCIVRPEKELVHDVAELGDNHVANMNISYVIIWLILMYNIY